MPGHGRTQSQVPGAARRPPPRAQGPEPATRLHSDSPYSAIEGSLRSQIARCKGTQEESAPWGNWRSARVETGKGKHCFLPQDGSKQMLPNR